MTNLSPGWSTLDSEEAGEKNRRASRKKSLKTRSTHSLRKQRSQQQIKKLQKKKKPKDKHFSPDSLSASHSKLPEKDSAELLHRKKLKNKRFASGSSPWTLLKRPEKGSYEYKRSTEYVSSPPFALVESIKRDLKFVEELEHLNFKIERMLGDGSCFFRAIADQIYGDADYHPIVRSNCMDHIEANQQYFAAFITEPFEQYVGRKRLKSTYANHLEIQAAAEVYGRPLDIYYYNNDHVHNPAVPLIGIHHFTGERPDQVITQPCLSRLLKDKEILLLSYHNNNHYNSLTRRPPRAKANSKKILTELPVLPGLLQSAIQREISGKEETFTRKILECDTTRSWLSDVLSCHKELVLDSLRAPSTTSGGGDTSKDRPIKKKWKILPSRATKSSSRVSLTRTTPGLAAEISPRRAMSVGLEEDGSRVSSIFKKFLNRGAKKPTEQEEEEGSTAALLKEFNKAD